MNIDNWRTVAAENTLIGSINWSEGQPPSTVNNSARQMMADVAEWRNYLNTSTSIFATLGYTPVQQGTGVGQLYNTVKIGWSGTRLKATVDTVDQGAFVTEPNLAGAVLDMDGKTVRRNGQHLYGPDNLTNLSQLANGPGYITSEGRAYGRKWDGSPWNLVWQGQGAPPGHLIGSDNGVDFYAYSPGLLSVGYAGNADTVDGYHGHDLAKYADFASGSNANGYWYKIPLASGPHIIRQRGRRSSGWTPYPGEHQETVYFPVPYGDAGSVFVTLGQHGANSNTDGYVQLAAVYADRFVIQHQHPSSGNMNYGWDWMAEGH